MKRRVFTQKELLEQNFGNITYYMAWELKRFGAPIEFNRVDLNLKPSNIKINGYLREEVRVDGSHLFEFEEIKNENL